MKRRLGAIYDTDLSATLALIRVKPRSMGSQGSHGVLRQGWREMTDDCLPQLTRRGEEKAARPEQSEHGVQRVGRNRAGVKTKCSAAGTPATGHGSDIVARMSAWVVAYGPS